MGASSKQIAKELQQHQTQEIELLAGSEAIFNWFVQTDDLYVFTQGWCIGLDVVAIKTDAELSGRKFCKSDYRLLRVMGKAAAAAINKQREK